MKLPKTIVMLLLLSVCAFLTDVCASDHAGTTQQACQLVSANPPGFRPFAFVPTVVLDKRFKNRYPKVSYTVGEDGRVINVKVIKGTGSPKVDAGLVKSIQAWRYKPQPGCAIVTSMMVTIDIR